MEIYSNTTRFALACNTSSKIIEPIQSRCAIVRYSKLGEKDILERLLHVCQQEKVCHTSLRAQATCTCVPATCEGLQSPPCEGFREALLCATTAGIRSTSRSFRACAS